MMTSVGQTLKEKPKKLHREREQEHSREGDCRCTDAEGKSPEKQHFQVIVVGAGIAGTSAAYFLARAGVDVLLLERGPYSGAKNLSGGAIYSLPTRELFPDFWEEAPVERVLVDQQYWLMTETSAVRLGFTTAEFDNPPYNKFSVFRATFDRWYASKAIEAGVTLWTSCKAESILFDGRTPIGVRINGSRQGEVFADIIILAEGVNRLLAEKAGLIKKDSASNYSLYMKQIFHLPEEVINERFHLKGNQGSVIGLLGYNTAGLIGTGSIYTFKEHIAINTGASIKTLAQKKVDLVSLMERTHKHQVIAPMLKGGKLVESAVHMIPEGGFNAMPPLVFNRVMLIGDTAGLVNGTHGLNLAMYSGKYAAESAIQALKKRDFSQGQLKAYRDKLEKSFVLKDLRDNRRVAKLFTTKPHLYADYINLLNQVAFEVAAVFPVSRREKRTFIRKGVLAKKSPVKIATDLYKVIKVIK